jgi:hypothetical protein
MHIHGFLGTVSYNTLDDSKQAYYTIRNPYLVETFLITLRRLSLQANYTDRATSACRRS